MARPNQSDDDDDENAEPLPVWQLYNTSIHVVNTCVQEKYGACFGKLLMFASLCFLSAPWVAGAPATLGHCGARPVCQNDARLLSQGERTV